MENSERSGSREVGIIFDGKLVTIVSDDDEMSRVEKGSEANAAGRCWCNRHSAYGLSSLSSVS